MDLLLINALLPACLFNGLMLNRNEGFDRVTVGARTTVLRVHMGERDVPTSGPRTSVKSGRTMPSYLCHSNRRLYMPYLGQIRRRN